MSIFCFKSLTRSATLAERLRQSRETHGLDLTALTEKTKIQRRYLEAIERGSFFELPKARAYRLAYIKEYAAAVGLNAEQTAKEFTREEGLEDAPYIHPKTSLKQFPFASISTVLRTLVLAGGVFLFGGYLLWQVKGILEPPRLTIFAPTEGAVTTAMNTTIQGETSPETTLTVNGQPITLNDHGLFETKIDLSEGLNTITVAAVKKHGKTSTVVRHVIVRLAKPANRVSLNKVENGDKVGL